MRDIKIKPACSSYQCNDLWWSPLQAFVRQRCLFLEEFLQDLDIYPKQVKRRFVAFIPKPGKTIVTLLLNFFQSKCIPFSYRVFRNTSSTHHVFIKRCKFHMFVRFWYNLMIPSSLKMSPNVFRINFWKLSHFLLPIINTLHMLYIF